MSWAVSDGSTGPVGSEPCSLLRGASECRNVGQSKCFNQARVDDCLDNLPSHRPIHECTVVPNLSACKFNILLLQNDYAFSRSA